VTGTGRDGLHTDPVRLRLTVNQINRGPWIKLVRKKYSTVVKDHHTPWKKTLSPRSLSTSLKTQVHITWFSQHRNVVSQWDGGKGLRIHNGLKKEGQKMAPVFGRLVWNGKHVRYIFPSTLVFPGDNFPTVSHGRISGARWYSSRVYL
jgi:hypothetical protein